MENSESEKMTITGTMVSRICSILGIVICIAGLIFEGSTTWRIMLLCNSICLCTGQNNEKNKKSNERRKIT